VERGNMYAQSVQFVRHCCRDIKPQMFRVSTLTFQGHVTS